MTVTDDATPEPATPAGTTPADERTAIAAVSQRIAAAWAVQDAAAFAEVFIEDGTMILPGHHRRGREAIREFMAAGYAGPYRGTRVTGTPLEIKMLGPGAAVLITTGGVLAPGEEAVADERAIRASWVVVKDAGRWSLAVYQNSPRDQR